MGRPKELVGLLKDFAHTEDKELQQRLDIAEVLFNGLYGAYQRHWELGEEGKEIVKQEEDVVQTHIKADIEAEEAVFQELERWVEENGYLLEYWAEELGRGEIIGPGGHSGDRYYGEDESFFVTLDGLDGSANFLEGNSDFSYGTMVAIARGENPTYGDFEVAGVAMHEEGWIVLGIKGAGVFVIDVENEKLIKLPKFEEEDYDSRKILADNYYPEARELLGDKGEVWLRTGSTAAAIVAIAAGKVMKNRNFPKMNEGWQGLVEVTRKKNLEQPILFLFSNTLGGIMADESGESIEDEKFKEWGQDEKLSVFTAKSKTVLSGIRTDLSLTLRQAQGNAKA